MRYKEFKIDEDEIFEIKMSPSSLKKLSAEIPGALAGIEFEMIVPPLPMVDTKIQRDTNIKPKNIQDIYRFYVDGVDRNENSEKIRRKIEEVTTQWISEYNSWHKEEVNNLWLDGDPSEGGIGMLASYIMDNREEPEFSAIINFAKEYYPPLTGEEFDEEEFISEVGDPEGASQVATDIMENLYPDYNQFGGQTVTTDLDRIMAQIWSDFTSDFEAYNNQSDWLKQEKQIVTMKDFGNIYGIPAPVESKPANGNNMVRAALSLSQALGREVLVTQVSDTSYTVVSDGSLRPKPGDQGMEFRSPPMPVEEMLSDFKKVVDWAKSVGAYTGKEYKTGLHMNLSVPGLNKEKLDYVKLALLVGDKYVLEKFKRLMVGSGETNYARSSLGAIVDVVKSKPALAKTALDKMRENMSLAASRAIYEGNTDKYSSINVSDKLSTYNKKTNRVEFRGPGGDYINDYANEPGKIIDTLRRFAVALEAASDPEKYKKEYQTKLYKLLMEGIPEESKDTVNQFVKYVAGGSTRNELKNFVKAAQTERVLKRITDKIKNTPQIEKIYSVKLKGTVGDFKINAFSEEDAIKKSIESNPLWANPAQKKIQLLSIPRENWEVKDLGLAPKVNPPSVNRQVTPMPPFTLWDRNTGQQISVAPDSIVNAPDYETAQEALNRIAADNYHNSENYEIRGTVSRESTENAKQALLMLDRLFEPYVTTTRDDRRVLLTSRSSDVERILSTVPENQREAVRDAFLHDVSLETAIARSNVQQQTSPTTTTQSSDENSVYLSWYIASEGSEDELFLISEVDLNSAMRSAANAIRYARQNGDPATDRWVNNIQGNRWGLIAGNGNPADGEFFGFENWLDMQIVQPIWLNSMRTGETPQPSQLSTEDNNYVIYDVNDGYAIQTFRAPSISSAENYFDEYLERVSPSRLDDETEYYWTTASEFPSIQASIQQRQGVQTLSVGQIAQSLNNAIIALSNEEETHDIANGFQRNINNSSGVTLREIIIQLESDARQTIDNINSDYETMGYETSETAESAVNLLRQFIDKLRGFLNAL